MPARVRTHNRRRHVLRPQRIHCQPRASTSATDPLLFRRGCSAFLRGHHEELGSLLVHVFTAAFWALDPALFVFCKSEDDLEGFIAVFAKEFVARHGNLRLIHRKGPSARCNIRVKPERAERLEMRPRGAPLVPRRHVCLRPKGRASQCMPQGTALPIVPTHPSR